MTSRLGGFIIGAITMIAILIVGAYLFIRGGGVRMETSADPLPLEETLVSCLMATRW